ncbi:tail assembly protein [Vibrio anguillarum]|uniref:Tail assembly protein n=1 Tax=Vibrio anguillarum TaxID=55601 RepID=A0AAW4B517_VIBAN|nr:tail assembly protein [Vibrio anguillarum]MBF4376594.1 tail assembly protein [Vibrio anguillarum]MBF4433190.1 tail assembly protein [Vibrio anguillarum]
MSYATILLSGSLAQRFGRSHAYHLDSGTSKEAFSALKNTLEGFEKFIKEQSKRGIRYAIFRNRENVGEDDLTLRGTNEIRIVPVVEGSKRGGVLQTIIGAVMVVAGVYFQQPWLVNLGVSAIAGGVIQMLSPQQKGLSSREAAENAPSYAFGGAVNTTASGHIVGIGYGERLIGGAVISAGIYAEDIAN